MAKQKRKCKGKGSGFEREFATYLSEWVSRGQRDDIFWRTQNSGGRATSRRKTGLDTRGQYGDIGCTDPEWAFVTEAICFELKRGYMAANFHDMFDQMHTTNAFDFETFLDQTITAHEAANTGAWVLVTRRDHRTELMTMDRTLYDALMDEDRKAFLNISPAARQTLNVRRATLETTDTIDCFTCKSADFWERVRPTAFINACRQLAIPF